LKKEETKQLELKENTKYVLILYIRYLSGSSNYRRHKLNKKKEEKLSSMRQKWEREELNIKSN
jgi:hypothetical protein